jgi:hypothetical protein
VFGGTRIPKLIKPARWLHAGQVEGFFDDTEIEVEGKNFEGARINYEGNRALSGRPSGMGPGCWMGSWTGRAT